MPASAFLLLASSAATRAASLNLCTDEYLLLLGRPEQVVSVSYLSQDPRESPLWREARRVRANRGSIEDVLTLRPNLVLTMGGGGRATALLARELNIKVIDLPFASDLKAVASNMQLIASALGQARRAQPFITRLNELEATSPKQAVDTIWISAGGQSLSPGSLGAQWLRLAGFMQRDLPGGRASLETLLANPPRVLIRSNYRSDQVSSGQAWLDNPVLANLRARQLVTDGRPWTCMGPLMILEIERLRRLAK